MSQLDPHISYNYSHEMIMKSAFELELQHLKRDRPQEYDWEEIETYLKDRILEITERWRN